MSRLFTSAFHAISSAFRPERLAKWFPWWCAGTVLLAYAMTASQSGHLWAIYLALGLTAILVGGLSVFLSTILRNALGKELVSSLSPLPAGVFLFVLINILILWQGEITDPVAWKAFFRVTGRLLTIFLFLIAFLTLATGVGYACLRAARYRVRRVAARLLVATALGLGFMGYGTFFLAWIARENILTLSLLALMFALIALGSLRLMFRDLLAVWRNRPDGPGGQMAIAPWAIVFLVFEAAFLSSLGSILSGDWDTFHQYLLFPNTYVRAGGLVPFPFHPHWGFPQLGEMLFSATIPFLGPVGPFMLHYTLFLLSAASFLVLLHDRRRQDSSIGPWYLVTFVSFPFMLTMGFGYLKIDFLVYSFFLAATIILTDIACHPHRDMSGKHIILGLLLGFLLATKYTVVLLIFSVFAALLLPWKTGHVRLKHILATGIMVTVLYVPWGLKDLSAYGTPFYPITDGHNALSETVGDSCQPEFRRQLTDDIILSYSDIHLRQTGVRILDNLDTFLVSNVLSAYYFTLNNPGLFLLLFLPTLLLFRWRSAHRSERLLLLVSLIYFAAWLLFLSGQIWYLAPSIFLWVILSQSLLSQTDGISVTSFKTAVFFLSLLSVSAAIFTASIHEKVPFFRGDTTFQNALSGTYCDEETRRCWAYSSLVHASEFVDRAASRSGPDVRIYGIFEPQGYFLADSERRFIPDFFGELFTCFSKTDRFLENLKTLRVRYILYARYHESQCATESADSPNSICRSLRGFQSFVREHPENISLVRSFDRSYLVYEVR